MMTCEEVRMALGAHALGALEPDEALEIDTHLATCDTCGGELLELAGVAGFLGKVSERDVELVASPPRQVLDRLLNDRVKRTRRSRVLMAVAASAAVLMVGGTVWTAVQATSGGEGSTAAAPAPAAEAPSVLADQRMPESDDSAQFDLPQPLRSASPAQTGAAPEEQAKTKARATPKKAEGRKYTGENKALEYYATVVALPMDQGTELAVQVSGVPVDTTCGLVVIGRDGRREGTESWVVSREAYADRAVFRRETTMPLREIDRFEIVDDKGALLVKVPVRK